EPEVDVDPFRKFRWGAYERLDLVEVWWYARALVYATYEPRGGAPPQKHYWVSAHGADTAKRLAEEIEPARRFADRIALVHKYFGGLSPAEVKGLQYGHAEYKAAQLNEMIPGLASEEVAEKFVAVFGQALEGHG